MPVALPSRFGAKHSCGRCIRCRRRLETCGRALATKMDRDHKLGIVQRRVEFVSRLLVRSDDSA